MAKVSRVIDEWLLIEYACTFLPMNQAALVEAVSKSGIVPEHLQSLGIELPHPDVAPVSPFMPFTPESELYQAIQRRIAAFDFEALAMRAVDDNSYVPVDGFNDQALRPGGAQLYQLARHPHQFNDLRLRSHYRRGRP